MDFESLCPVKSPNDDRTYEALILKNGIKLLLIHDQKAQKSACSISVGVGSLQDGQRSKGLAHFLQHMLFMGSRKFPRHNQYSQFMSLNGGMDNAWTSDEETNYYFEIANKSFREGVERITDFFVKALLTESCVQKERQAVHEECMLRTGQDNSRKWQILKHFAEGPYHNFSIGNNESLDHPQIVKDLVNFYNNEYSANRINAVLLSGLPIQEMKSLLPFFQQIENKNLPCLKYDIPYKPANIGKFVRLESIKDQTIMQFFWVIQNLRPFYKKHPTKYITHVLGHQGENSLLSILKKHQYACKIISYSHQLMSQTVIGLQIQLTQLGEKKYVDVYNLVIDYTSWIRAQEHIYNEIKQISQISFKFKEKGENYSYVCDLSSNLHKISINQILNHKAVFQPYDQQFLNHILKQINPFNLIIVYSSPEELQNPIVQRYLGGKFIVEKLPKRKNTNEKFNSLLKNEFLPLDTTLKPLSKQYLKPQKIDNIYFAQDNIFKICKGGLKLKIYGNESQIFRQFYASYLELLLKQQLYNAETLKLELNFKSHFSLDIQVVGFNDTIQKIIKRLGKRINKVHRQDKAQRIFKLCLDDLIEEYQNFYCQEVDEIASDLLNNILIDRYVTIEQGLKQLENFQYQNISSRIDAFWQSCSFEWIVAGNFEEKQTVALIKQFETEVNSSQKSNVQTFKCAKITQNIVNVTQLESADIGTSGVIIYHQAGPYSKELYYLLSLIKNYIKQPFFDQLRTQKQLAYYLTAYQDETRGILSLCFLLISSNKDPYLVSAEIKNFVANFISKAGEDLSQAKFESLKDSLRTRLIAPHTSINNYFEFICSEIQQKTFYFNKKNREQIDSYLCKIKKEELIQKLSQITKIGLQVWVVSNPHQKDFQIHNFESNVSADQLKNGFEYHQDSIVKIQ